MSHAMKHTVVWLDIPVFELDRAIRFYSAVLNTEVRKEEGPGFSIGILPHSDTEVGGCLAPADKDNPPSATGPLVYLNCEGRLQQAVDAVEANKGRVQQAIHPIGPHGFRAVVFDSEGNRIALHSTTN